MFFDDDTILLSKLGRFPDPFNALIAPYVNLSAARVSRQRSKLMLVFFGADESVVIQMTDKVLSDRISPELAAVLKEISSSNPLGRNTVLSPLHRELFFVEVTCPIAVAGRQTFKSSYRHSLPPSPLLPRDLVDAMLKGSRPPTTALQKLQLGSLGQSYMQIPDSWRPVIDEQFRKHSNGKGYLTGLEAAEIFLTAGLDRTRLSYVWDITAINQNGTFDASAFCQAMWLIESLRLAKNMNAGTAKGNSFRVELGQQVRWISGLASVCNGCCGLIKQGESCRWCAECNNGNYEFCESCYEMGGKICGHELKRLWIVQRPQYPFRWTKGWIVCTNCKTKAQPGELCYWCKVCKNGELDLCHSCHAKKAYNCPHWPLPLC